MRWAVIQFPGSNCDQDCYHVLKNVLNQDTFYVWHKSDTLEGADAVIVPGGFSYGDYLRCGAIARWSPVMQAVKAHAAAGGIVIGICNGFQVLCEAGLLPGALIRNRSLHFRCEERPIRVEHPNTIFSRRLTTGQVLNIPIAHGEGNYFADAKTLKSLRQNHQILFTYCDLEGRVNDKANPNGSALNIAGIVSQEGNVLGMMPHPERASELILGSADGRGIFESVIESRESGVTAAA
jgi:phosphoribosylformylglycinamidine synthase subunit PurQ / glutaminase